MRKASIRKASIVFAIAACAASSLSLAQRRDPPTDLASPAATTTASAESTTDGGTNREKSGFGQVMSVLTGLLQEAAGKEATGASSTHSRTLSSDQSAVTITVTPVAGRSTFYVNQLDRGKQGSDSATPSSRVAVTAIDADAAQAAQVAMQAETDVPD